MQSHSDGKHTLIRRILPGSNPSPAGRAQAWEEWQLGPGGEDLRRFIRSRNYTAEPDDDIFQDAVAAAFQEVERGHYRPRPGVPFTAYVKGIARNKIREARRRHRKWTWVPLEDVEYALAAAPEHQPEVAFEQSWRRAHLYEGMADAPPTRAIHSYSDEQIDQLPLYQQVPAGQVVRFSERLAVELSSARFLYHPDFLVYRIVAESLGDRPVYFASTAPPIYEAWDLQPHLVRHGLAYKLVDEPIESTENMVELDLGVPVGWIDRERGQELLWNVFQVDYLLEKEVWPEPSTRASIPMQYYLAYLTLGFAHDLRGDSVAAQNSVDRAGRFRSLAERVVP